MNGLSMLLAMLCRRKCRIHSTAATRQQRHVTIQPRNSSNLLRLTMTPPNLHAPAAPCPPPYRTRTPPLRRPFAAQVLWKAIERVIPDIRQRIDVAQVGTPLTHERFLRRHRGTYGELACLRWRGVVWPCCRAGECGVAGVLMCIGERQRCERARR